ncbi:MAG: sortase [Clostridia bacterium]|nr:sortase [Clostridia bacterium]
MKKGVDSDKKIESNNTNNINKNQKKSKSTIILQFLLLFSVSIFIGMLLFDFHSSKVMDKSLSQVVNELDKKIEENKEKPIVVETIKNDSNNTLQQSAVNKPLDMSVKIGNSTVLGKIKISKIDIEYPILEYKNDDTLWKSICKISNNSINGTGNLCLAGHNMRNMTMFGKLRNVKEGDIVEITNIYGQKYTYVVYEKYYINPEQTEVLKNTSESIVTMITCNNTSSKRLIVRARLQ